MLEKPSSRILRPKGSVPDNLDSMRDRESLLESKISKSERREKIIYEIAQKIYRNKETSPF